MPYGSKIIIIINFKKLRTTHVTTSIHWSVMSAGELIAGQIENYSI